MESKRTIYRRHLQQFIEDESALMAFIQIIYYYYYYYFHYLLLLLLLLLLSCPPGPARRVSDRPPARAGARLGQ